MAADNDENQEGLLSVSLFVKDNYFLINVYEVKERDC